MGDRWKEPKDGQGTIYLLHFDQKFHHAQHYLGWTARADVAERIFEHLTGKGSPLVKAAIEAGINVWLARTWHCRTRSDERALKNQKKSRGLCPVCRAEARRGPCA